MEKLEKLSSSNLGRMILIIFFFQVTALLTPEKELPPTPIDALAKLDSLVYNGTTGSKPEIKPESKPEIKPDISSSKPETIKPDTVSGSKPEVRTESSKPETEAKKETEVPEPNGIEPFKETYFDEHNHVHYFRYIIIQSIKQNFVIVNFFAQSQIIC